MSELIFELYSDCELRDSMSESNISDVEKKFNIRNVAAEYLGVYEGLPSG